MSARAQRKVGKLSTPSTEPDAKLRRLWAEYLDRRAVYEPAVKKSHDSYNAILEEHGPLFNSRTRRPIGKRLSRFTAAIASEPHRSLYSEWCDAGTRLRKVVKAIQKTPAEGPYGLGVKLAALEGHYQEEDLVELLRVVLADINRLTGAAFKVRPSYN